MQASTRVQSSTPSTMRIPDRSTAVVALLLASALVAAPADAQRIGPTITIAAGASTFDASGTGTAPTLAARFDAPLGVRWLLAEASAGYSRFGEQFGGPATNFGVLEGQLQVQLPLARVRPYLGLGTGWASYLSNAYGRDRVTATQSVSGGVRLVVSPRMIARGELRVRGWARNGSIPDGYVSGAAETTIGIGLRF